MISSSESHLTTQTCPPFEDVSNFGSVKLFEVTFQQMPLGLIFSYRSDKKAIFVSGFEFLAASLGGAIKIGDEVVTFGGVTMSNLSKDESSVVLKSAIFPLTIRLKRRASTIPPNSLLGTPIQPLADPNVNMRGSYDEYEPPPILQKASDPRRPTELVAENVEDMNQLTQDVYAASLELDTHNRMRQQAAVMTNGVLARLPALNDQVTRLVGSLNTTLSRLESLEKDILGGRSETDQR